MIRWNPERSGSFTLKSAYGTLVDDNQDQNVIWSSLWKLKIPQRCKTFLWLVLHNRLLTNESRAKRGLCLSDSCDSCPSITESCIHILRDCKDARYMWSQVVKPSVSCTFFSYNLWDWVRMNLKKDFGMKEFGGPEFFVVCCWILWNRRNERVFDRRNMVVTDVIYKAKAILDSGRVFTSKLQGSNIAGSQGGTSFHWERYPDDFVQIFVDGACSHHNDAVGCGGILKNNKHETINGFILRLDGGDSLMAELWGCLMGMRHAWDGGYRKLVVHSDSSEAIALIRDGCEDLHVYKNLVDSCRCCLDRDWQVNFVWIPRDLNKEADSLAKVSLSQALGYTMLSESIVSVWVSRLLDAG